MVAVQIVVGLTNLICFLHHLRKNGRMQAKFPSSAMSGLGPGCVKTRGSSIGIEQVSLFKTVSSARIASPFNFEVELKNIILVALRDFEFSHSLGQKRT
jgi:hypothetical protein